MNQVPDQENEQNGPKQQSSVALHLNNLTVQERLFREDYFTLLHRVYLAGAGLERQASAK